MLLLSIVLMVWAIASSKWVRMTLLAHPLQSKTFLCSLGQSSSGPRRITCSPHPLHSRTICPKASTEYSSPSPCHASADSCKSCIPLLLLPHSASETIVRTSHLRVQRYASLSAPPYTKHSTGVTYSNERGTARRCTGLQSMASCLWR